MQTVGVSMLSMLIWGGSQGHDLEGVNASWKIFEKINYPGCVPNASIKAQSS